MFIMAATKDLPKLMDLTGVKQQQRHRVMILGGGLVGNRVAQLLEDSVEVTLLEKDEKSAEELSFSLKNAEVLQAQIAAPDFYAQPHVEVQKALDELGADCAEWLRSGSLG